MVIIFTLYKQNIIILPSIYAIIQPHYDPLARLYAWQKCLWECLMAQKKSTEVHSTRKDERYSRV